MISIKAKQFDAILFDMDGVLVDSEPLHFEAFRQVLGPMGLNLTDEYLYKLVGDPLLKNLEDIQSDFEIPLETNTVAPRIEKAYMKILEQSEIAAIPGIYQLLRQALQFGLKTGICTSSPRYQAEMISQKIERAVPFQISGPLFNEIVSVEEVEFTKPDPQPYQKLAAKLGVTPQRSIAIEDSPSGVESAKAAGCFTIALLNHYNQAGELGRADLILDSLTEVSLV